MTKVIGMLLALAMFYAIPGFAFAQIPETPETPETEETPEIVEETPEIAVPETAETPERKADEDVTGVGDGHVRGGGNVAGGGGGGGGGVTSVQLARTGFDAWILALVGGLLLAGGLGLFVAQRRGRIGE